MRFRIRRKYIPGIIVFGLLILMVITNPGQDHFKSYIRAQLIKRKFSLEDIKESMTYAKTANYIIFSQYSFKIKDYGVPTEGNYIGVFECFISTGNFTADED